MRRPLPQCLQQCLSSTCCACTGPERGNDQSALHHLYLNRSRLVPAPLSVRVDASHEFSLQLFRCHGGADGDGPRRALRKGGPFEYCWEKTHMPLEHVHARANGGAVSFREPGHEPTRPWLIHSNGLHYLMRDKALRPLTQLYDQLPDDEAALRQPVLLVETREHGNCNVSSLGWLLNASRWPEGAPSLRL